MAFRTAARPGRARSRLLISGTFEEPRLPRRINKTLPAELDTIVCKAIGKTPAERYATAQELADDLRRFLDDQGETMPTNKPPTSFRLSEEAKKLMARLAKTLRLSQTAVVEMAIRQLARRELGQGKGK